MKKICIGILLAGTTVMTQAQMAQAQVEACATAKQDLNGSWKLNLVKSSYGQVPSPSGETEEIRQTADGVTFSVVQTGEMGALKYVFDVKADGTETVLPKEAFPSGSPLRILTAKMTWKCGMLEVNEKAEYQGGALAVWSRFSLSADGKTLSKVTSYSLDQGDFDVSEVYDKQ